MEKAKDGLNFEAFQLLAVSPELSQEERVGFGVYAKQRSQTHDLILKDMGYKIPSLFKRGGRVLEIGIGCGDLALRAIERARELDQKLTAIDSKESLDQLPNCAWFNKMSGKFPSEMGDAWWAQSSGSYDAVVMYSVAQYLHAQGSWAKVLDKIICLLAPGGRALIGDLPNAQMRERYFTSLKAKENHEKYYPGQPFPEQKKEVGGEGEWMDSDVMFTLSRARNAGCHSWVMPQMDGLIFEGRREDILIEKP